MNTTVAPPSVHFKIKLIKWVTILWMPRSLEPRLQTETTFLSSLWARSNFKWEPRSQFISAGRDQIAQKEEREIKILSDFLPEQLPQEEIEELITKTIIELNAESPQDMGKVMGFLKPDLQGKVDMSLVSKLVKEKLTK